MDSGPPSLEGSDSNVYLIRQGFTNFNFDHIKLKKEATNDYASKFKELQARTDLCDAELHEIGIQ